MGACQAFLRVPSLLRIGSFGTLQVEGGGCWTTGAPAPDTAAGRGKAPTAWRGPMLHHEDPRRLGFVPPCSIFIRIHTCVHAYIHINMCVRVYAYMYVYVCIVVHVMSFSGSVQGCKGGRCTDLVLLFWKHGPSTKHTQRLGFWAPTSKVVACVFFCCPHSQVVVLLLLQLVPKDACNYATIKQIL